MGWVNWWIVGAVIVIALYFAVRLVLRRHFTRHWKIVDSYFETDCRSPLADPESAAIRLLEHAHAFEPNSGLTNLYRKAQWPVPVKR